jgi:hypothetical protein
LRKTLAWYSRGLHSGAELRQRGFAEGDIRELLDLGEAFFDRLAEREASHGSDLAEAAVDAETKYRDRHTRRSAGRTAGDDSCAA